MKLVANTLSIRAMPDKEAVHQLLLQRWNEDVFIIGGRSYDSREFDTVGAFDGEDRLLAIAIWSLKGRTALLGAVDSIVPGSGASSALVRHIAEQARRAGARSLRAVTTNDNLRALGYYQKLGFRLTALFVGSVDAFRGRHPRFRAIGFEGIPVRDTLELEMDL